MTRVLVCGGRYFEDVEFIVAKLNLLRSQYGISEVIHGAASGADSIAGLWSDYCKLSTKACPANWSLGRKAGFLRNEQMLRDHRPDLVVGFPGGNGTAHMVQIAHAAGVPVISYPAIYFRKEDHQWGFLSNFHACEFADEDGVLYPSNEHYYQSRKTLNERERSAIVAAITPAEAKRLGKRVNIRSDWDEIKRDVMMIGLRLKFAAGSDLAARLLSTDDDYLFEYTTWNDTYWGVNTDLRGHNWLGRLLMERRVELAKIIAQGA